MVVRNCVVVVVVTLLYSVVRYNVFGTVPVSDIPTLIVNKSVSFSLVVFLLLAAVSRLKNKKEEYKRYMQLTKMFVIIHVLLSLCLLTENNFPKLFDHAKLTIAGGTAMLFGVLALLCYLYKGSKTTILIFCLFIIFHLVFIGYKGWFAIEKWNGTMPPITLICTLLLLVIMILAITLKKKES